LISCSHLDMCRNGGTFCTSQLSPGYRPSVYTVSDYVITGISVGLRNGSKAEIKEKMDELMGKRRDKQPLEYPSSGSVFKRPEGYFAGALIEQSGLKGRSVGGAQVSEKHAGFIINKGGATTKDVVDLIELCKDTVFKNTGVLLEPEIKTIEDY
ncbi:MAG: UDP-N-acetylenolpyruvoylglucosamine reductase, partial [Clostridia bacterium]|nr:UDP-N-acetylenolpyruvoylglucosamine reductase [Clostridia bacterium]